MVLFTYLLTLLQICWLVYEWKNFENQLRFDFSYCYESGVSFLWDMVYSDHTEKSLNGRLKLSATSKKKDVVTQTHVHLVNVMQQRFFDELLMHSAMSVRLKVEVTLSGCSMNDGKWCFVVCTPYMMLYAISVLLVCALVLFAEVDHGYASTQPMPYQRPRQRTKSRTKVHGSLHRCVFSELESHVYYWDLSFDSDHYFSTTGIDFYVLIC